MAAKVKEFSWGRTLHSKELTKEGRDNFDKIDWSDGKNSKAKDSFKGMATQA